MDELIVVNNLSRNYKVAKRNGHILKFLFARGYDTIHAVNNISFSIKKGEMVGFVGPNGAGKSTTIKMFRICGPPFP